jgi:TadE-like protein
MRANVRRRILDQLVEAPKVFATKHHRNRFAARRAAAAAELAICLPLIVFLLLASLEACSMIFLDHSLTIASYEGVRVAINYDGNNPNTITRCNQILTNRGVHGATISLNPSNVANVNRGDRITITVSAPCSANAILPLWFYSGKTLSSATTMVKE